jgi:hypothetical protein
MGRVDEVQVVRVAGDRRASAARGLWVGLLAMALALALLPASGGGAQAEDHRQYPFACTVQDHGLGQPKVDNQDGRGIPVYAEDEDGAYDPATSEVVGYSADCDADTRVWYYAVDAGNGRPYIVRGYDEAAGPDSLEAIAAMLPNGIATTEVVDVDGVSGPVPYLIRHERGVINRFMYAVSMLVDVDEVVSGDPAAATGSIWNGRVLFQFQGGVGIGHTQGRFDDGAARGPEPADANARARAVKGEPDRLGKGYAVIYSTGTRTGDHYNLLVGGRTAEQVKDHFVATHGEPRYTVAVGGSGGAIQQYVYLQNHPDLIDAGIPQMSYPDMTTQTIHVGDCALLDRYMDLDAAGDPTWQDWDNRQWLQGLNSIEGRVGSTGGTLRQLQQLLGLPVQTGTSECLEGWLGLAALVLNPHYGLEANWELLGEDQLAAIEKTHWRDAVEAYGVDPATGFARVPWDNVGVQYGLRALVDGRITPEQFLDVNARVGSWKEAPDMVQEGAPFVGADGGPFRGTPADIGALLTGQLRFDPWSMANQQLSPDDGATPAPRRAGDEVAIANAYDSGLVFLGAPAREIPIIDARSYLEHVLDMHNTHQSFAVRERLRQHQGHADNQLIWFLDTDASGNSPAELTFYEAAFDTIADWIANLQADPTLSVHEAKPAAAVDRCVGVDGTQIAAGDGVWAGILEDAPDGACTASFELYTTSRIEAGGPITGDVYKCHTMSVDTAVAEGVYGSWVPDDAERARLQAIHPGGVCDYGVPGVADPRAEVAAAPTATTSGAQLRVEGAEPRAEVQLRRDGEVIATTTANPNGRATFAPVEPGTYVVAQLVGGQRSLLSEPIEVAPPGPGRGGGR